MPEENNGTIGKKLTSEHLNKSKRKKWMRRLMWVLGGAAVAAIVYFLFFYNGATQYEFVKAERMDIKETVEITGNVEPNATITLSFRASGTVDEINFEVGDRLKAGDVIAELDNVDQELALERARAVLSGNVASLNERRAGSTSEQVLIAESRVKEAEAAAAKVSVDFQNAKDELDLIRQKYEQDEKQQQLRVDDAEDQLEYTKENLGVTGEVDEQAIENAISDLEVQLFSASSLMQQSLASLENLVVNDGTNALGSSYFRVDRSTMNFAKDTYFEVKKEFDPFYDELKTRDKVEEGELLVEDAQKIRKLSIDILAVQKDLAEAFNILPASADISEAELNALQNELLADSSSLSQALATLDLRIQNLQSALIGEVSSSTGAQNAVVQAENFYNQQLQALEQMKVDHQVDLNARQTNIEGLQSQYEVQLAAIESAKANLAEVRSGPRAVDLAFLQAQVAVGDVDVKLKEEDYQKTLLIAPTDGVLSRKNIEVGEDISVTLNREIAFEMISDEYYKIDADIAEVDIGKIAEGDSAQITLDAIGDEEVFEGTITQIDPVETLIQDVVFYKAEITVESDDPRIKPGMTANIEIVLNEANNALAVPDKAVVSDGDREYVRCCVDGEMVEEIDVVTGIRNLEGDIEIKEGLEEGQEIILRTL